MMANQSSSPPGPQKQSPKPFAPLTHTVCPPSPPESPRASTSSYRVSHNDVGRYAQVPNRMEASSWGHPSRPEMVTSRSHPPPRIPSIPQYSPFLAMERHTYGSLGSSKDYPRLSASGSNFAFLDNPPPFRRSDTASSRESFASSHSDSSASRRPSLLPRSAVAEKNNFFDLDFSFLDDEMPAAMSTNGRDRAGSINQSLRLYRQNSGALKSRRREGGPQPGSGAPSSVRSGSRMASASPERDAEFYPAATLPFPSRPSLTSARLARSKSAHSTSSRSPRLHNADAGTRCGHTSPRAKDGKRLSQAAGLSSAPTAPSTRTLSHELKVNRDESEEEERRKRLVLFLDETAAAMEGGRSLAMVLPNDANGDKDGHGDGNDESGHRTFSQMAESVTSTEDRQAFCAPRFNTNPFDARRPPAASSPGCVELYIDPTDNWPSQQLLGSSSHSNMSQTASSGAPDRPHTIYFSPNPAAALPSSSSEESLFDNELRPAILGKAGLGVSHSSTPSPASSRSGQQQYDRSPVTVRAESPCSSPSPSGLPWALQNSPPVSPARGDFPSECHHSPNPSVKEAQRVKAKMVDKRRRVVEELIQTEASYATDMAVVRDIYLARARGADIMSISDHVMSTGLGLPSLSESPPTPPPSATRSSFPAGLAPPTQDLRRPSLVRRVSAQPVLEEGVPIMSAKDIHMVFANLEEIAGLANDFAHVLDAAWTEGSHDMSDKIGMVFVEMMPRMQVEYGSYCARHHRAITRLQELVPDMGSYLAECSRLSKGRTGAWDLASLLIKPVQRALKYPLLINSIISVTPDEHPDKTDLLRAYADVMAFAEHLNHVNAVSDNGIKKQPRRESVAARAVVKKDGYARRESTASAFTRKFLRPSSGKSKSSSAPSSDPENHDMFDALSALVDSNRSLILRFETEMRKWTKETSSALETHQSLVQGWIDMYAASSPDSASSSLRISHQRLELFMEVVLDPVMTGPLYDADRTVRHQLLVKTEHLLSMFESPRAHILQRNNKMLEHSRYQDKHQLSDRAASEEFRSRTASLVAELPPFLSQIDRYFKIIHTEFESTTSQYAAAVQGFWDHFDLECFQLFEDNSKMMGTLAAGLRVINVSADTPDSASLRTSNSIRSSRTGASKRASRSRFSTPVSLAKAQSRSPHDNEDEAYNDEQTHARYSLSSVNRSSLTSDSSATPSHSMGSTAGSSLETPRTPPEGQRVTSTRHKKESPILVSPKLVAMPASPSPRQHRRKPSVSKHTPLPPVPAESSRQSPTKEAPVHPSVTQEPHHDNRQTQSGLQHVRLDEDDADGEEEDEDFDVEAVPVPRARVGRQHLRPMSHMTTAPVISVYVEASEGLDDNDEIEEDEDALGEVLYLAAAMASVRATTSRGNFPLLSHEIGDTLQVYHEEADQASGGSGWLLGRKEDGTVGWGRTENFHLLEAYAQ